MTSPRSLVEESRQRRQAAQQSGEAGRRLSSIAAHRSADAHTLILFIATASLLQNPGYRESMNMYTPLLS